MAMPAIEIDAQDTGQDEQPGGKPDIGHRIDLHAGADQREYQQIPVEWINVGPWQPRRKFDREQLDELAGSIRKKGIVQPILLRPTPNQSGRFQIVAGERRWRAAQIAELHGVPSVVRDLSDAECYEIALIENKLHILLIGPTGTAKSVCA